MAEAETLERPAGAPAEAPAPDAGVTSAPATESAATTAAPADAAPVAGADAGKDDGKPKSALDAVKRVMEASRQAAADAAAPADKKEQPGTATTAAAADTSGMDLTRERITDGEWRALPEKERQRITQFRAKLKEFGGYIQDMTPKARTFDDLDNWMRGAGVTQDDFVGGLQIIALLRTDPVKAWEALQPVIADLRTRIGDELPEDLRKAVEEGTVSEAHAKELSLARNERKRLEALARNRDAADVQRYEQAAVQAEHDSIRKAIDSWEATWRASDPDYPKKAERVWESMFAVMEMERKQGKPLTQARVLEIAKEARTKVESWMSGLVPAARPKTPVTANGSGAATVKQPGSALEAARLALGR